MRITQNTSLFGLTSDQIQGILPAHKPFRARQVFEWVHKGIESIDQMANLPKQLRSELTDIFGSLYSTKVISVVEDEDGTSKLLLECADSSLIECVLLTDEAGRRTACLSSQVGCAMGCAFCRTGTMGLKRSLEASEIVEQFSHLQSRFGKLSNVVFMGMGEPLANLSEVRQAIGILHDPKGADFGLRRITISTCGLADGIRSLAQEGPHVRLAVSLVSAEDEKRTQLMPVNRAYDLRTLRSALGEYQRITGRRITLEYVLLNHVNDSRRAAGRIIEWANGLSVIVNVIPYNPAAELEFSTPEEKRIREFCSYLETAGIPVARRFSRGRGVNGACGQLATSRNKTT